MIRIKCPVCHGILFLWQFNQPLGRTTCHFCSNVVDLSEAVLADPCWRVDLSGPVPGAWIKTDGRRIVIGASTRGAGAALALAVLAVLAGLSWLLLEAHWTGQGGAGNAVLAGLSMAAAAIMAGYSAMILLGRVTVHIKGDRCRVFSGIGPIGWVRSCDWSRVKTLSEEPGWCRTPGNQRGLSLTLEGDQRAIRFGAMLNDVRRYFVFTALCKLIDARNAGQKNPTA